MLLLRVVNHKLYNLHSSTHISSKAIFSVVYTQHKMQFLIFVSLVLTALSCAVAAPVNVAADGASVEARVEPVRGPIRVIHSISQSSEVSGR